MMGIVTEPKRTRKNRHGMTISDAEVNALLQLFRQNDRGGDPRVLMRSEPIRRFRAALQRITDRTRMRYGGRQAASAVPVPAPVAEEDGFPGVDGSDGGPTLADRVLGMFDEDGEEAE
jgi:hypothetical protein